MLLNASSFSFDKSYALTDDITKYREIIFKLQCHWSSSTDIFYVQKTIRPSLIDFNQQLNISENTNRATSSNVRIGVKFTANNAFTTTGEANTYGCKTISVIGIPL